MAFQEVRSSAGSQDVNQIGDLNSILGQYEYRLYAAADKVKPPDKLYKSGWEMEGTVYPCPGRPPVQRSLTVICIENLSTIV